MENTIAAGTKNDVIEFAKVLGKLEEEELKKIYYMIKGIELINETEGDKAG